MKTELKNNLHSNFSVPISVFIGGIIFIVTASNNWLDAYLARKYHWVAGTRKILDPITDKLLVNGILIVLVSHQQIMPVVLLIIFIIRDILINALRMVLLNQVVVVPANNSRKGKTTLQMVGIVALSFGFGFDKKTVLTNYQTDGLLFYGLIQNGPMVIAAFLTTGSLIQYGGIYLKNPLSANE